MSAQRTLHGLLADSARKAPTNTAVDDPETGETITYGALEKKSNELTGLLVDVGVRPGDRVGLLAPKSIDLVCSLFSVLKAGAAYVPVDPGAPPMRSAYIFKNCGVSAVIGSRGLLQSLCGVSSAGEWGDDREIGTDLCVLPRKNLRTGKRQSSAPRLAYILYTSGSTGKPKGVMHTHASALSFVDWCSSTLEPNESDHFSSHAPFHFDLSILDIFVSIKHMARLVLIGDSLGKQPMQLAKLIEDCAISIWYSTPSILRLLVEYGKMERHDYSKLRMVLFAGEVFPLKHYYSLREFWPHPRFFNLYGPTETNVCTYYEVPENFSSLQLGSFPIGITCSGDETKVIDETGLDVSDGTAGELYVSGGTVMAGYWNLPEQNDSVFSVDEDGKRWYRTGDIVVDTGKGLYMFLGRRDRMIKRRGYRVELGEIDSALYQHPSITEAATISVPDEENGVLIKAFISWSGQESPSLVQLKQYCVSTLPRYMVPDSFMVLRDLPKTSTDKIDYQRLKGLVE